MLFRSSLDKEKQHVYLMTSNNQTRIVSKHETSRIFKMYEVKDGIISYECNELPRLDIPLSHESIVDYVSNIDISVQQGIILLLPSGKSYKIFPDKYCRNVKLRGNESSIRFRYIQLRTTEDVEDFVRLYEEHIDMFNECEDLIEQVVDRLLKEYVHRHIRPREFKVLPKDEHWILKQAHTWHCEDRKYNKVHWDVVSKILDKSTPSLINGMIKRQYAINNNLVDSRRRPLQPVINRGDEIKV